MNLKKAIPSVLILISFLILSFGLFPDAFNGKVVQQPDMMSFRGISSDVIEYKKETGKTSVWTNSVFGGMPTYIWAGAPYTANKLKPLQKWLLNAGMPFPSGYFFTAFLAFFILTLVLRINPWIGFVGSLAFGLSTYNFLISEAGHASKFLAIMYFPMIAAGTILVYRAKYLIGGLLFGLGLGLNIMASHVQMTYYFAICMAIFVLVKFAYAIKEGTLPSFAKASAFILLPLLLAVGSNASQLWTSYDYMKESIRGPQILEVADGDSKGGLDKDYVFSWSHGIGESLSFIIPGAYGGGSAEGIDKSSATYKDLKRKGAPARALKSAPLYWGDMPSTSGPIYFGAIVIFLFVFGLMLVEGSMKWWLLISTILITLLSYGKNMMWFNDIFYNYFPLYDKFRSVNSILSVLQFTLPMMGILGLTKLMSPKLNRENALKKLYIATGILGGFVLFMGLVGGSLLDFTGLRDQQLISSGYNIDAIISDRKSLLRGDAFRSLFFILAGAGLIWLYIQDKLKGKFQVTIIFGLLGLLMIMDLGGVGKRYLNSDNFVKAKRYESNFDQRPVDKQILADTDPNYRVFDLSIPTFQSNSASNHHKTIGGYHAAKLRRYMDMIERHIGVGNQKVLDMLNTRYFITKEQQVQRNPGAMGNAWFVNNIQKVNTPDEEIGALNNIDPKTTAVMMSEFDSYLGGFTSADGQGSITLSDYKPDHLTYTTNTNSEQFAVFSEVIYKPNSSNGWKSYIDGKEVDHVRANYILRAMKVPAGQHTIEFKFKPTVYYAGETISLISSLLLILGLIGFLVWSFKNRNLVKD